MAKFWLGRVRTMGSSFGEVVRIMPSVNVFYTDVSDFYFAVVWINVNRLACEFSMDDIMIMQKN